MSDSTHPAPPATEEDLDGIRKRCEAAKERYLRMYQGGLQGDLLNLFTDIRILLSLVERLQAERNEWCDNATEWELENVTLNAEVAAMRPVVEAAREVSEELEAVGSPSVSAALHLRQSLDQIGVAKCLGESLAQHSDCSVESGVEQSRSDSKPTPR